MASSSRTARKRSPNRRMTQLADEREYLLDIVFALAQVVPRASFKQCLRSHELSATTMAHLKLEKFCPPPGSAGTENVKTTASLISAQHGRRNGSDYERTDDEQDDRPREDWSEVRNLRQDHQPNQRTSRSSTPSNAHGRRERTDTAMALPKSLYDDPEPTQMSDCERALQILRSARELEKKSIEAFPQAQGNLNGPSVQGIPPVPFPGHPQQVQGFVPPFFGGIPPPPPHFYPPPSAPFAIPPGYAMPRPNVHDSAPEERKSGGLVTTPRSSSNPWEVFRTGR